MAALHARKCIHVVLNCENMHICAITRQAQMTSAANLFMHSNLRKYPSHTFRLNQFNLDAIKMYHYIGIGNNSQLILNVKVIYATGDKHLIYAKYINIGRYIYCI